MGAIYTFGYQGRTIRELEDELARIRGVLVDVRLKPWSKDPQWSKRSLRARLGDSYVHVVEFGNVNYKNGGRIKLKDPRRGAQLCEAIMKGGRPVVLLCYERSYKGCHRRNAAFEVQNLTGSTIRHLMPGGGSAVDEANRARQVGLFDSPDPLA